MPEAALLAKLDAELKIGHSGFALYIAAFRIPLFFQINNISFILMEKLALLFVALIAAVGARPSDQLHATNFHLPSAPSLSPRLPLYHSNMFLMNTLIVSLLIYVMESLKNSVTSSLFCPAFRILLLFRI